MGRPAGSLNKKTLEKLAKDAAKNGTASTAGLSAAAKKSLAKHAAKKAPAKPAVKAKAPAKAAARSHKKYTPPPAVIAGAKSDTALLTGAIISEDLSGYTEADLAKTVELARAVITIIAHEAAQRLSARDATYQALSALVAAGQGGTMKEGDKGVITFVPTTEQVDPTKDPRVSFSSSKKGKKTESAPQENGTPEAPIAPAVEATPAT